MDNARDEGQVRPLLPGGGHCVVVVTSRNLLAGLVAADGAAAVALDRLPPGDARELLVQRLGEQRLAAEPAAAAEVAGQCAGLPLALNIMAARLAAHPGLPLADLAAEFRGARLNALEVGDAATSMRAALSCSYRNLGDAAARAFRLLALHPGPEVSEPAAASLLGVPIGAARASLRELSRSHLLTEPSPGRYAFHDLVRLYAAERAADASHAQRNAALHRLLDHEVHTGVAAALLLLPTRQPIEVGAPAPGVTPEPITDSAQALTWFETEHRVLLAAIDIAAREGFDTHTWQIAWTMRTFVDRRGHWRDWTATQQAALAAAQRLGDRAREAHSRRCLGAALTTSGRTDEAIPHLRAAVDLYRQVGDSPGEAYTHLLIAKNLDRQRCFPDAIQHAQQAVEAFDAVGERCGLAHATSNIGWFCAKLGDYRQAISKCTEALALHRELGYRNGEAATWDSLGYACQGLGDPQRALECYEHSLRLFRQIGNLRDQSEVLTHIGDAWLAAGDVPAASRAWQEALAILDGLHPGEAAQVRAKLRSLSAGHRNSDKLHLWDGARR